MATKRNPANAFCELVLNSVDTGIVALDDQGRIIFANKAAAALTARDQQDLLGKPQHAVLGHATQAGELIDETDCPICAAVRGDDELRSEEFAFHNRDGVTFPVELVLSPLASEFLELRAVLSFSDLTDRWKMHRQLVQSQKLQSIGELAAGIAHEINTPVQYINDNLVFLQGAFGDMCQVIQQTEQHLRESGYSDLQQQYERLSEEYDTEFLVTEVPTAIVQSIDGTERVATIVRAMKEFAHPSENVRVSVDLNRVIESAVTVARNEWKYVADLDLALDPMLPNVSCLRDEMHQVILNLVVNAAHAIEDVKGESGEKGRITIATRKADESVEVRISDTGGGIPESLHTRVFDPFFTTKEVGRGTGQGLSLAHTVIVEQHSGFIDFECPEGGGTTFVIRLPMFLDVDSTEIPGHHDEETAVVC